ncbi:hypothetical protein [Archangium lipolyticum]|uniref:hypothetical protein n=1 Tax=Archangium lipolyticum TaxID=2970465 RepID=UPI00214A8AA9|nr:hypothetical protein [Archangium lipolyticum]
MYPKGLRGFSTRLAYCSGGPVSGPPRLLLSCPLPLHGLSPAYTLGNAGEPMIAPGALSLSAGHLDVYARGTDNALWHKWYTYGWSNWEWLGGEMTSSPSAESWGPGRMDIFYRGPDSSLRHSWWNNGW